jgi:muconate cycloisomerase
MKIDGAELFFLRIPFQLSISHAARTGRTSSDSLVIKLSAGQATGYGEAVVREYVSGSLGGGAEAESEAVRQAVRLVASLAGRELSWEEASDRLRQADCGPRDLPLACAVETALMDIACGLSGRDVFDLLGREPVRSVVSYGGAIPMIPPDQAARFIARYTGFGFPNLKVKVGADTSYNALVLAACRTAAGPLFDIRVDANSSWDPRDADRHLETCSRFGVSVVEEPFPASLEADQAMRRAREQGFRFVADEGFRTAEDVRSIASAGTYQTLNLRLSKNGGLTRTLRLASEAEAAGLSYQLGCMVGETGILSALGRAAAAILPDPLYVEGSYDDVLLSENVTTESFGFGAQGKAPIVRGRRVGYEVDSARLARLAVSRASCL